MVNLIKVDQLYCMRKANTAIQSGFEKPKYIWFCEQLLLKGFDLDICEAITTRSKYVYVNRDGKQYKVRFSNHKPNKYKEKVIKDCDFFVGRTHTGVRTTHDALQAVYAFFNKVKE